jgi:hypothetical protein
MRTAKLRTSLRLFFRFLQLYRTRIGGDLPGEPPPEGCHDVQSSLAGWETSTAIAGVKGLEGVLTSRVGYACAASPLLAGGRLPPAKRSHRLGAEILVHVKVGFCIPWLRDHAVVRVSILEPACGGEARTEEVRSNEGGLFERHRPRDLLAAQGGTRMGRWRTLDRSCAR